MRISPPWSNFVFQSAVMATRAARREESRILRTKKGELKSFVEGGLRQVSQPGGVRMVKLVGGGV